MNESANGGETVASDGLLVDEEDTGAVGERRELAEWAGELKTIRGKMIGGDIGLGWY